MKKRGLQYIGYPELPSSNNTNVGSMQCQIESFAAGPWVPWGVNQLLASLHSRHRGSWFASSHAQRFSTNSLFKQDKVIYANSLMGASHQKYGQHTIVRGFVSLESE